MEKILIIKLGAMGDVIRTIPLAKALKKKHPLAELTWVTKKQSIDILKGEESINIVKTTPYSDEENFDTLYNFDIEEEATNLAIQISAKKKYGFYSEDGFPAAFNLGAEYYLNTLFDDELKKSNKKTYQEMMFDAAELPPEKIRYRIQLTKEEIKEGQNLLEKNNLIGKEIIGIHMGSSPRWPSKTWAESELKKLIKKLIHNGKEVIIFGGPDEVERQARLGRELEKEGVKIYRNKPENTLREFTTMLNLCESVVCSDSLALHVAVGLNKPTIALFFCSTPHEVETYGLITKIVSPMLHEFFPERMDQYDEALTKSISADEVLSALENNISHNRY